MMDKCIICGGEILPNIWVCPLCQMAHKCIICGKPAPYTWFCECCTEVKEKAYKECREKGIDSFYGVIELRDRRLSEHKENEHK